MAEIEIRAERLEQYEQKAIEKQHNRRKNQMLNQGFSGGGRPQSAAGRRSRVQKPTNQSQALPDVDTTESFAASVTPSGMVNQAFDDPDIEEVITNVDTKQKTVKASPEIKKVEVAATDEGIEEVPLRDNYHGYKPVRGTKKEIEDELEDLKIEEPAKPVEKPKKKKRKPKPEKEPEVPVPVMVPESTYDLDGDKTPTPGSPTPPTSMLRREDTVLFPGDEYYQDQKMDEPLDLTYDTRSEMDPFVPVEPEGIMTPDIRPASRLSIATNAGSAGIEDIDAFVFEPAPQDELVKCRITRDRKGIDNRAYPMYYLHMEREGMKKVFLLGAKKRKKTTTSSYVISTDPTDVSRKNESFVAKLRSNMMGTRFTCYDNGKAYSEPGALIDPEMLRKEMVTIGYETNVLGFKGPRKMTVAIPGMDLDGERVECQPHNDKETLTAKMESKNHDNITILQNKSPVWNEDSQSYVLNFHGRVTQASVKNFQIVHEKEPDYIVLQFGRVEDDVFTMDFKYPLCAVQAFSIALSSFDNKLACE